MWLGGLYLVYVFSATITQLLSIKHTVDHPSVKAASDLLPLPNSPQKKKGGGGGKAGGKGQEISVIDR